MNMRKLQSNRKLGIESLENRVVFADDLVMVDVDLLIQWNVIARDSDFAIENKNTSVSVSRDRLSMTSEGVNYLHGISSTPSHSAVIVTPAEKLTSNSPSLESVVAFHETLGTPKDSSDQSVATHLALESSHPKSSGAKMESDLLDSNSLLSFGPSSTDSIDAANEVGFIRSLARDSLSSAGSDVQFLDPLAQMIQASRPFESMASATKPKPAKDSSEFIKPLDESFASWGIRRSSVELRSPSESSETRFKRRHGTDLLKDGGIEDGGMELFGDSFYAIALPAGKTAPAAHSWSLLFGVVQPASPLSADIADSELAGVRRAVLEIVAESERADLQGTAIPTMYSSNGWKATSILAAAFFAVLYRSNRQPDTMPSLVASFRKQRLPSRRPRRS